MGYNGPMPSRPDTGAAPAQAPADASHPAPEAALRDAVAYYEANAERFDAQTADLDLDHALRRFLPLLPPGGAVLDAGCGPGRDLARLAALGYGAEGFDPSPRMAALARERAGVPVRVLDFASMDYPPRFDGVFANASLLHVPPAGLDRAMRGIAAALAPGGALYLGLKHGSGSWLRDGLYFRAMDEAALRALFAGPYGLTLHEVWTTPDLRPGRGAERWLHCTARKAPAAQPPVSATRL